MSAARLAVALLALAALGGPAAAHGMRTAYLELTERSPGRGTARLSLPQSDPLVGFTLEGCSLRPSGGAPGENVRTFAFSCGGGLQGRAVRLRGLGPIVTEAAVRATFADGDARSTVLRAEAPDLTLRGADRPLGVMTAYVRLGLVHILSGLDHLLFLLALALQLGGVRAVLVAETAFTLSHSLSFSATALGLVQVSPAAAEACIALSLVALARELVQQRPVSAARGARVALLFGLVHGLGFAGGLREIGLPERDVGLALVGFGAGVEAGQLAFLAVVLSALTRRAARARQPALALGGGVAVGTVGIFWLCARLGALWS